MNTFFKRIFDKKVPAFGLAAFRVLFFTVFFFEVLHMFEYRKLYYDMVPYLESSEVALTLPFLIWLGVILMIIVGLYTRWATIINYLFILVYLTSLGLFEYHMDYVYTGISFLCIFLPVSKVFSMDRLLRKIKYSRVRSIYNESKEVRVYTYFIPVLFGLALVYADSILYKITSPMWMNGLGMWLPSSITAVTISDDLWLLNHRWLVKFLGYLTVVFEAVFLFAFWFRWWRVPVFLIGLGLHLGILIEFPIPYFALGACALYVLMVPFSWWRKLGSLLPSAEKKGDLEFFYDSECPLCLRTKLIIQHFDVFKKVEFLDVQSHYHQREEVQAISYEEALDDVVSVKDGRMYKGVETYRHVAARVPAFWILWPFLVLPGTKHIARFIYSKVADARNTERCTEENCGIRFEAPPEENTNTKIFRNLDSETLELCLLKYGVIVLLLLQVNVSLFSPYPHKWTTAAIELLPDKVEPAVHGVHGALEGISRRLAGITRHPVFMDGHFRKIRSVSVEYLSEADPILLPMTSDEGLPGEMLKGGSFVNWTFRVSIPRPNDISLSRGLERYTAFWLSDTGRGVEGEHRFRIKTRSDRATFEWEEDLLKENMERPWDEYGEAVWKNGFFEFHRLEP